MSCLHRAEQREKACERLGLPQVVVPGVAGASVDASASGHQSDPELSTAVLHRSGARERAGSGIRSKLNLKMPLEDDALVGFVARRSASMSSTPGVLDTTREYVPPISSAEHLSASDDCYPNSACQGVDLVSWIDSCAGSSTDIDGI